MYLCRPFVFAAVDESWQRAELRLMRGEVLDTHHILVDIGDSGALVGNDLLRMPLRDAGHAAVVRA